MVTMSKLPLNLKSIVAIAIKIKGEWRKHTQNLLNVDYDEIVLTLEQCEYLKLSSPSICVENHPCFIGLRKIKGIKSL